MTSTNADIRPRTSLRPPLLAGTAVVLAFFAGFGGWAATAPLAGAAVAPALVAPEGSRKTVQHLEGGIVRRILVHDGSLVAAGQPLVELDDTRARAEHAALLAEWRAATASEARLLAEQAERTEPAFPAELLDAAREDPALARMLAGEVDRLSTRRASLRDQQAILADRVAQAEAEIVSTRLQPGCGRFHPLSLPPFRLDSPTRPAGHFLLRGRHYGRVLLGTQLKQFSSYAEIIAKYSSAIDWSVIKRRSGLWRLTPTLRGALHPSSRPMRARDRRRRPALTVARTPTFSSPGTTAMGTFSQSSHHSDGSRAWDSLGPTPAFVLAHPDRMGRHDDERPRPVDIGWHRARRLRLLLADAEAAEPRRWSD